MAAHVSNSGGWQSGLEANSPEASATVVGLWSGGKKGRSDPNPRTRRKRPEGGVGPPRGLEARRSHCGARGGGLLLFRALNEKVRCAGYDRRARGGARHLSGRSRVAGSQPSLRHSEAGARRRHVHARGTCTRTDPRRHPRSDHGKREVRDGEHPTQRAAPLREDGNRLPSAHEARAAGRPLLRRGFGHRCRPRLRAAESVPPALVERSARANPEVVAATRRAPRGALFDRTLVPRG